MHAQLLEFEETLTFDEVAVSNDDAADASDRFVLLREGSGFVIRRAGPRDRPPLNLVSKAELMELVDYRLEQGAEVRIV